jgi:hypothetical protein
MNQLLLTCLVAAVPRCVLPGFRDRRNKWSQRHGCDTTKVAQVSGSFSSAHSLESGAGWFRGSFDLEHCTRIVAMNRPLTHPSAFVKATADKSGTLSPTGGEG